MSISATTEETAADPDDQTLIPHGFTIGHAFSRGQRGTTPITEARTMQRLIFALASHENTDAIAVGALARAWCALQDSIRIMRGIPLPGQLRPDLPPMKGLKGKRARQAMLLEMAGGSGSKSFVEATPAGANELDTPPANPLHISKPPEPHSAAPEVNTSESKAPKTPTTTAPATTRKRVKS